MQEPGRRPVPPFAGVDLRRPKGYPAPAAAKEAEEEPAPAPGGDPCPRCGSRDTKFCYYNNYNTSQPRHFCKSCRRYWTKGGSLRNVPVGGGTRKSSSSSSSSATSTSPGAAPKNTKRSKNSKRRRVAPAPDPAAPGTDASTATADVANTAPSAEAAAATVAASEKPTTATEEPAAAVVATETKPPPAAPPAAVVSGFTDDTSTAPRLGLADVGSVGGAKELLPDPSHFEWPSGCDLGSYWGTSVFADTDPALFLSLP